MAGMTTGTWTKRGPKIDAVTYWTPSHPAERPIHYRGRVLYDDPAPLAAWKHVLSALPWKGVFAAWVRVIETAYLHNTQRAMSLKHGAHALQTAFDLKPRLGQVVQIRGRKLAEEWLSQGMGPLVLGGPWTAGMLEPDRHGYIHRTGSVAGGHAVALVGLGSDVFRIVNNAGVSWGQLGRAWMDVDTVSRQIRDGECYGLIPADAVVRERRRT